MDTNFASGSDVKVATVVAVAPTVKNDTNINSDVDELTVKGKGFDAGIAPQTVSNSTAQIL